MKDVTYFWNPDGPPGRTFIDDDNLMRGELYAGRGKWKPHSPVSIQTRFVEVDHAEVEEALKEYDENVGVLEELKGGLEKAATGDMGVDT